MAEKDDNRPRVVIAITHGQNRQIIETEVVKHFPDLQGACDFCCPGETIVGWRAIDEYAVEERTLVLVTERSSWAEMFASYCKRRNIPARTLVVEQP